MGACAPLATWSPNIYLWGLVSARSHALLRHWLRHYRAQGIRIETNAELVVEGEGPDLAHAVAVMHSERVHNYSVYPDLSVANRTIHHVNVLGVNAWLRAGVNDFLSRLPADAWLIWADVDEFFAWPCDIRKRLIASGHAAVCGRMQDRVSRDWTLAKVIATPNISSQFPICARIRRDVLSGLAVKITLIRARIDGVVPQFWTAHTAVANSSRGVRVMGGYNRQNCYAPTPMHFAHYSTTDVAVQLSHRKKDDFALRDGPAHAGPYEAFNRLAANGSFTEDARSLIRAVSETCYDGCASHMQQCNR